MEVDDRLKIAGKLIPSLEVARRMGMNKQVLEGMLLQSMNRAEELRSEAIQNGKPALPSGQALSSAFDQIQYAHGGFHDFFYETRKAIENQAAQVVVARGRAVNGENEWRDQGPEMRKCLGELNDIRRAANGGFTAQTENSIKQLEAIEFVQESALKNATGKRLRVA